MAKYANKRTNRRGPASSEPYLKGAPRQDKNLSQIFLRSPEPAQFIAASLKGLGIKDVLEIGPGGGILTRELLSQGFRVTSIEQDERFVAHLSSEFQTFEAPPGAILAVVHADFLQYNLNEWVQAAAGPCAIVGNIPYHISSPILLKVLEAISPAAHEAKAGVAGREAPSSGAKIQAIMFMTQKEFAERLCAQKNSKAYGSLSVYAQLRAKISLQYQVPKEMFTPIPKVDSTIFLAEPLPPTKSASELSAIESLTRLAFAQRRKKLSNSLASLLAHVSVGNKAVDPCPINLSLRADALTPDDFCQLNRWLHEAR